MRCSVWSRPSRRGLAATSPTVPSTRTPNEGTPRFPSPLREGAGGKPGARVVTFQARRASSRRRRRGSLHQVDVPVHIVVPEAQHAKAQTLEMRVSASARRVIVMAMLLAIDFDDEPRPVAGEVDDVSLDRNLSPKVQTPWLQSASRTRGAPPARSFPSAAGAQSDWPLRPHPSAPGSAARGHPPRKGEGKRSSSANVIEGRGPVRKGGSATDGPVRPTRPAACRVRPPSPQGGGMGCPSSQARAPASRYSAGTSSPVKTIGPVATPVGEPPFGSMLMASVSSPEAGSWIGRRRLACSTTPSDLTSLPSTAHNS